MTVALEAAAVVFPAKVNIPLRLIEVSHLRLSVLRLWVSALFVLLPKFQAAPYRTRFGSFHRLDPPAEGDRGAAPPSKSKAAQLEQSQRSEPIFRSDRTVRLHRG